MIARVCLVTLAIAVVATAAVVGGRTDYTQPHQLENYTFDDFVAEFKRPHLLGAPYNGCPSEYKKRKAIFEANMEMIKKHNANPNKSWTMNINRFGDMTKEEFTATMTGYNQGLALKSRKTLRSAVTPQFPKVISRANVPSSVDWRTKGVTTPVKNQGQCGSCWAFAATATYEAHAAISTGHLTVLAPQQATSCVQNPRHCGGTGGCNGATCELAFDYWSKNGATTNDLYPYTSGSSGATGACRYNQTAMPPAFINKGYVQLPENDLDAHLEAVSTKGPLAISVAASDWMFYSSGVFTGCSDWKNVDVNHAVVLEGYGEAGSQKYWLVRNSWGTGWGEKGYIRVLRRDVEQCGTDPTPDHGVGCDGGPTSITVCGTCGILSDTSYPTGITLAK